MQASAIPHEDLAEAIVGAHQPVFDSQPSAQRQRPRLLGEKRVRARLDQEAVHPLAGDAAAQPLARLDQRELQGQAALGRHLDRAMSGAETGDAAADDDQPGWPGRHQRGWEGDAAGLGTSRSDSSAS